MHSWVALSESPRAPPVALRPFIEDLPDTLWASGKGGTAPAAASKRKQQSQQGRRDSAVVFVISASPSVDSALVPPCLLREPDGTEEEGREVGVKDRAEYELQQQGLRQGQEVLTVSPHSCTTPASLRCDRLLLELYRSTHKDTESIKGKVLDGNNS